MTTGAEHLGPYRITREIGRGGMGVVYLARDPKLDRDVAIKVLPDSMTCDKERVLRFEREAKLLASLSHANIAQVYGFEDAGDKKLLVLEFVEGETLARRIGKGPLPVDEALETAKQLAEALEAAHRKGVIHRDLKPSNVVVTPDGTVKVLDFGLARVIHDHANSGVVPLDSPTHLGLSPTITADYTQPGVVLGTAPYMSPEQARGRPLDKRTDIWSFGVMLYECLTGRMLFRGETATDSMGAIMHREPDWSALPAGTPPTIQLLLRRCLTKNPKKRLHDIADARIDLEDAISDPSSSVLLTVSGGERTGRGRLLGALPWALAAAATIAAVTLGIARLRDTVIPPPERFVADIVPPEGLEFARRQGPMELSPDGRRIAFVGLDDSPQNVLCVRDLGSGQTLRLDESDSLFAPFWSPDGRWVAYFSGSEIKRIESRGGNPEVLADVGAGGLPSGGAWSRDDIILYSTIRGPLMKLDLKSGSREITLDMFPDRSGDWPTWPSFLPDGTHVLFTNQDDVTAAFGLYVGSIQDGSFSRLLPIGTMGRFVAPNWLYYWRAGDLYRQPFDLESLQLTGQSERIVSGVWRRGWPVFASFSVTADMLAYLPASATTDDSREFFWYDRSSQEMTSLGVRGSLWNPAVSPDGTRIAFDRTVPATGGDIFVLDLERGIETALSRAQSNESVPRWTPDGSMLYFFRGTDLFRAPSSGAQAPELVLSGSGFKAPVDVSPDGKWLMYQESVDGASDLHLLDIATGKSAPWLVTPFQESWAAFSPDGRWVAYGSDASGETRIMLRGFPAGDVMTPVSIGFGRFPRWARDELLYLTRTELVSVTIGADANGRLVIGQPTPIMPADDIESFDVAPDGKRLLISRSRASRAGGTIRIIKHWDRPSDE